MEESVIQSRRYLFFVGTMGSGGAERVISILSNKLAQLPDTQVIIITYYNCKSFYELDSRIIVRSLEEESSSKSLLKNLKCLRSQFLKHRGIIISFLAPFNILALLAHTGIKTPIVVADRNDPRRVPQNRFLRGLRDSLYLFADAVVVQTNQNMQYFSSGVKRRTTVIYNPVDLKEKAGRALHTEKKQQIVSVARLVQQKNQRLLIDSFSMIERDFPEYELIIYGDGPEKEKLEQYAYEKGVSSKVHMPGNVADVPAIISEAELFVLPSDFEGMPNALIEAMCVGLPVISTKVSGATDLIIDGENGALVEIGDSEGLADTMRRLLCNADLRKAYGKEAIKLNAKLDMDRVLQEWMRVIEQCTEKETVRI